MACYEINYNPFNDNTVVIKKNGITLANDCMLVSAINHISLQRWFDHNGEWRGLGKELEDDNNEEVCEVVFIGRAIDYRDLKDYFDNHYKSDTVFKVKAGKLIKNDNEVFGQLKDIVERLNKKNLKKNSSIDISKALDQEQINSITEEFNKIKAEPFTLTVLATVSSGKSTLLNSLLHKELLPTGNDATTASVVEILDTDEKGYEAETYDRKGNIVHKRQTVDLTNITKFNLDKQINKINIYCDIPTVTNGDMVLLLRDTPGPNNSEDPEHARITQRVICPDSGDEKSTMSAVLYVINAANPRIDDEAKLLRNIANEMEKGGKQANERFFFVINKVDERFRHETETLEKLIDNTKAYLEKFSIYNPRLFPVSAYLAERIWKKRAGEEFQDRRSLRDYEHDIANFSDEEYYEDIKLEKAASVSQQVKSIIDERLNNARNNGDKEEIALIHSGIPTLEEAIKEYIQKYAYPTKISDAVKKILIEIDDKNNREYFLKRITESQIECQNAQNQIDKKKERRENKAKQLKQQCEELMLDPKIIDEHKSMASIFVRKSIEDLTSEFKGAKEIEQTKADEIINLYKTRIEVFERSFEERLKEDIQNKIYNKAKILLLDYQNFIETLEKDFQRIDGFDFSKVSGLKRTFFYVNVEAMRNSHVEDKTEPYATKVYNPDYHWWTFWRSEFIYRVETRVVGKLYFVNKEDLARAMNKPLGNFYENINSFYKDATDQINRFKQKFNSDIEILDKNIDTLTKQLKVLVEERRKAEFKGEAYKNRIESMKQLINEIKALTDY